MNKRQLFAQVVCFIAQRLPGSLSPEIGAQCLPTFTQAIEWRQFFPNLDACLQVPIDHVPVHVPKQCGGQASGFCLHAFVATHRLAINRPQLCPVCPVLNSQVAQFLGAQSVNSRELIGKPPAVIFHAYGIESSNARICASSSGYLTRFGFRISGSDAGGL